MKLLSLMISAVFAFAAQAAEYTVEKDIPFLGSDREEKMDAYLPSAKFSRPVPAVIWIHGGSWRGGDKAAGRELNVCQTLAENGYAAFSINYMLSKKAGADTSSGAAVGSGVSAGVPWPQNFHDCKSALRYLRKEAQRFGIDPERIAVSGGSAGGHLALLAGVTGNSGEMNKGGLYTDQSNRVSCIIDFYGVAEIAEPRWTRMFAGATPEETKANVKAASPATYLSKDTPPMLIVHGTADSTVPISYSRDLVKQLEALGIPHQYIEIPGAPHTFHLQPKEMDLRPAVLEFLGKYLGKPATKS